jgi:hypothetical protein
MRRKSTRHKFKQIGRFVRNVEYEIDVFYRILLLNGRQLQIVVLRINRHQTGNQGYASSVGNPGIGGQSATWTCRLIRIAIHR